MEKRVCPECSEAIRGRLDKKFCSDMCRNTHNNKQNSDTTNYVRNINNALRRNRRVLEEHLKGDTATIPKQKLVDKGLSFRFYTNQHRTINNHTYFFCYEYAYRFLENDMIMIVKKKPES